MIPQDLHIHTIYSIGDNAVVNEQTITLIKQVRHAARIGISDHFEYLVEDDIFDQYQREVRSAGFALEHLLATGKPVIVAHPLIMGTDLDRIPPECFIEVNNR